MRWPNGGSATSADQRRQHQEDQPERRETHCQARRPTGSPNRPCGRERQHREHARYKGRPTPRRRRTARRRRSRRGRCPARPAARQARCPSRPAPRRYRPSACGRRPGSAPPGTGAPAGKPATPASAPASASDRVDGAADGNADGARHVAVGGDGAHAPAGLRALEQEPHRGDQHRAHHDDGERLAAKHHARDLELSRCRRAAARCAARRPWRW